MEEQGNEIPSPQTIPVKTPQTNPGIMLLVIAVVSAGLFGTSGYFLGKISSTPSATKEIATITVSPTVSPTPLPTSVEKPVSDVPTVEASSTDKSKIALLLHSQDSSTSLDNPGYYGSIVSLVVTDAKRSYLKTLYIDKPGPAGGYSLPIDAWSPDGKYIYLEFSQPDGVNIYIFQANGSAFADGSQFIDVSKVSLAQTKHYLNGGYKWIAPNSIQFEGVLDISERGKTKYIFNVSENKITEL